MFCLVCAVSFAQQKQPHHYQQVTMIICHEPRSTLLRTSKESSSTIPDGLFPFKKQHWFTLKRQGKMSRPKSGHGTSNQCHLKGKTRWGDLRFMKMRFQYMSSSCNFRILQQNISYDEHSAVAHAILLSSFIEHVDICLPDFNSSKNALHPLLFSTN